MLTQIDVVYANENGDQALALPIRGLNSRTSYLLSSVTGLHPPDVDLFIGDYARDGGFYQGRRVGPRNPVMTIDLNPNPALGETVAGLRELLYKALLDPRPEADYVRLVLRDDYGRVLQLVGYIEKLESDIFSEDTQVVASFICPDPYIRDVVPTELKDAVGWPTVPFAYQGTAETGFEVEIRVLDAVTPLDKLVLANNGRLMQLDNTYEFGQTVYINTIRGGPRQILMASNADVDARSSMTITDRWKDLRDNNLTTSQIARLSVTSPWLELHSQANSMQTYSTAPNDGRAGVINLTYRGAYWGV